jgi:hypothetical protein
VNRTQPAVVAAALSFAMAIVVLIIFRWPLLDEYFAKICNAAQSPVEPGSIIPIAGVHAAALSILFAALWALTSNVLSALTPLEETVYNEMGKLPGLQISRRVIIDGSTRRTDNTATLADRMALADRLYRVTARARPSDVPQEPEACGAEALRVMDLLAQAPPFTPPYPHHLTMVKPWARETERLTHFLLELVFERQSEELQNNLEAFLRAQLVQRERERRQRIEENVRRMSASVPPTAINDISRELEAWLEEGLQYEISGQNFQREFVQLFHTRLIEARKLARSLRSHLEMIESFKQRRLEKPRLLIAFACVAIAFLTGVLLPLIGPPVWQLWLIWVPCMCYSVLFIFLLERILKA